MLRPDCGALHETQQANYCRSAKKGVFILTSQCKRTFLDLRIAGGLCLRAKTEKPFFPLFLEKSDHQHLKINMTQKYSQRSLIVLSLLGILSAIMSVLSVILIFQLQSQQTAVKESPPSTSSVIPAHVWAVLLPVATVLSALSLTLNLSSVVVCLLHSYFSTEVCRGEQDTERYLFLRVKAFLFDHLLDSTCSCGSTQSHCAHFHFFPS